MKYNQAIGKRLRELLKERKITQLGFAESCNISRMTINGIVKGRVKCVRLQTLCEICKGLKISFKDFFDSDLFRDLEQEVI